MKFYFTYSSSGMAYEGGWTEVEAPSITIAVQAFTAFHRAVNGITACSDIYTESEFRKTGMLGAATSALRHAKKSPSRGSFSKPRTQRKEYTTWTEIPNNCKSST